MGKQRQARNGTAKNVIDGKAPALAATLWPLAEIEPYPNNPRTHPPGQIAMLAEILRKWGPDQPIVVDEDGVILKGHGRRQAAILAGLETFPVVRRVGLTLSEKSAMRIEDNQVALLSGWDHELMKAEITQLQISHYPILSLGFPETQLRTAFGVEIGQIIEGKDPEAAPPLPKRPVSRRGDLWVLGDHRLLCGDATSSADVGKCLAGAVPHLMVTDPPYGVDYNPKWRDDLGIDWTGQAQRRTTHPGATPLKSRSLGKVKNDHVADWTAAWKLFKGEIAYVWHGGLHAGVVQSNLEACGFHVRAQIIWVKQHFVFSRGDYHWQHEPCWYAVRKTGRWTGDRKQTTTWAIGKDDQVTGHGTQKPVECMKRPMMNNSQAGDAVYEPFCGSGTTIIAAEIARRCALCIEIDPAYVDVAVRRWQSFTGLTGTLEASGATFDQVATQRARRAIRGAPRAQARRPAKKKGAPKRPLPEPDGASQDPQSPETTS